MNLRPALVCLLPILGACADDSFAVISVLASPDPIDGVAQFRVNVGNDSKQDTLYYPNQPTAWLRLDNTNPVTFSVEFSSSRAGEASFEVEALDTSATSLGYGKSSGSIAKSKVVNVTVSVVKGAVRPQHELDAGPSGDSGISLLSCDPYAPALACGANRTCGLVCDPVQPPTQPAVGMCYASGVDNPGSTCTNNNDCVPGSQCFTFPGCSVKTCLQFCDHNDAACGDQSSYCNIPIECGTTPSFAACSRPCDPTGSAIAGCAPGLACFVYRDETTDCACAGLGTTGTACTQNSGCVGDISCAGCQAGSSCVVPTGASADGGAAGGVCRPICNLGAPTCAAGMTCHAFDKSTRRLFGFCE
jgi:hypothetical protein